MDLKFTKNMNKIIMKCICTKRKMNNFPKIFSQIIHKKPRLAKGGYVYVYEKLRKYEFNIYEKNAQIFTKYVQKTQKYTNKIYIFELNALDFL